MSEGETAKPPEPFEDRDMAWFLERSGVSIACVDIEGVRNIIYFVFLVDKKKVANMQIFCMYFDIFNFIFALTRSMLLVYVRFDCKI